MGRVERVRRYKSEGRVNDPVSTVYDRDRHKNVNGGIGKLLCESTVSFEKEKEDGNGGGGDKC